MISAITLKASVSGIITGVLLAIARIAGETAPLLFTALSNQFWSTDMMQPVANLPVRIRFINDILLSAPSIVVGLFVYTIVVSQMQHFSGWAGVAALALLQIPIVIRTTENMLRLVPDSMREDKGIDGLSWSLFTESTPPPNTAGGGLANALAGSGLLIFWSTFFGTPLGIMAGIWLAEYGRKNWLAEGDPAAGKK
ncbi:hypothetical protein CRX72_00305 [Pantoea sp. BRM17]|nr:hypothetical protein CRX72_00305 [Pantoea sp. BRM17]